MLDFRVGDPVQFVLVGDQQADVRGRPSTDEKVPQPAPGVLRTGVRGAWSHLRWKQDYGHYGRRSCPTLGGAELFKPSTPARRDSSTSPASWLATTHGPNRRDLPAGSTLLFYTDGLIERRGHDIHASRAQLVALLARHGDRPLPELIHRISNRPADPTPGDDVVVLALRVP
ncbi:SpoIIE family protein phosphatase [Streptomyces virginiae]|uniref:SpoIIE family protein phosphatase n=1 Tax=Streptomyces virginiae TaxID=1961 RepID=UPI0037AED97B